MEKAQQDVLNWAVNASRLERMEFIKSFLDTVSYDEVKVGVMQLCKRAKRKKLVQSTSPSGSGVAEVPSSSTAVQAPTFPAPCSKPWWTSYKKHDILALDCEMVPKVVGMEGKKRKCVQVLASVALVNFKEETVYNKTVRREPGSYHVTNKSMEINGITRTSLQNGDSEFSVIQNEVTNLLENKLIITVAGKSDFDALNIRPIDDYSTFDLQTHWYRQVENERGLLLTQRFGLKEIYGMYFNEGFQLGIHSPVEDAKATMKIFREIYVKIKTEDVETMQNNTPFV